MLKEITEWLRGLEATLNSTLGLQITVEERRLLEARRGFYEGIAEDIERKWPSTPTRPDSVTTKEKRCICFTRGGGDGPAWHLTNCPISPGARVVERPPYKTWTREDLVGPKGLRGYGCPLGTTDPESVIQEDLTRLNEKWVDCSLENPLVCSCLHYTNGTVELAPSCMVHSMTHSDKTMTTQSLLKEILDICEKERMYWNGRCEGGDLQLSSRDASDGWAASENIAAAVRKLTAVAPKKVSRSSEVPPGSYEDGPAKCARCSKGASVYHSDEQCPNEASPADWIDLAYRCCKSEPLMRGWAFCPDCGTNIPLPLRQRAKVHCTQEATPGDDRTLPCIRCNRPLSSALPDHVAPEINQPSNGLAVSSPGHYGTTVFDPGDDTVVEVNVCDPCLRAAIDDKRAKVFTPRFPAQRPDKAPPYTWSVREHVFAAVQQLRAHDATSTKVQVKGGGYAELTLPEHVRDLDYPTSLEQAEAAGFHSGMREVLNAIVFLARAGDNVFDSGFNTGLEAVKTFATMSLPKEHRPDSAKNGGGDAAK